MKKIIVVVLMIVLFVTGGMLDSLYNEREIRREKELLTDYVLENCENQRMVGMMYACLESDWDW